MTPIPDLDAIPAIPQPTLGNRLDAESCEILLIRHGRSADVRPGSPESADPPLHELGQRQVSAMVARLAPVELRGVFSSHLIRALDTARPLAETRGLEVGIHDDLEEIRLGEWGSGEFRRRAACADPDWIEWSRTGRWDGIPGCEGDDGFRTRVGAVVDQLAAAHRGQRIAVVAHGGVVNAYLSLVLDVHRSLWMSVENTSITVIRMSTVAGPTVVTVNDCHHLYDPVVSIGT